MRCRSRLGQRSFLRTRRGPVDKPCVMIDRERRGQPSSLFVPWRRVRTCAGAHDVRIRDWRHRPAGRAPAPGESLAAIASFHGRARILTTVQHAHFAREAPRDAAMGAARIGIGREDMPRLPRRIAGPVLRQVQATVDQGLAEAPGIGEKDADLAILDATRRPRLLACDPNRVTPLLQKARLVDHQHAVLATQRLHDIGTHLVAQRICIRTVPAQQTLDPPGTLKARVLRQHPTHLARNPGQQTIQKRAPPSHQAHAGRRPGQGAPSATTVLPPTPAANRTRQRCSSFPSNVDNRTREPYTIYATVVLESGP